MSPLDIFWSIIDEPSGAGGSLMESQERGTEDGLIGEENGPVELWGSGCGGSRWSPDVALESFL